MAHNSVTKGGSNGGLSDLSVDNDGSKIKQEIIYPSVCWGCLMEGDLKDMHQTYYYNGKPEVYAELLSYCFSIQVDEDGKQYYFCETCVMRLREAANFRTQLEVTRSAFSSVIEQKLVVLKDIPDDDDGIEDVMGEEEWLEDIKPLAEFKTNKEEVRVKSKKRKTKSTKKSCTRDFRDAMKVGNVGGEGLVKKRVRQSGTKPRRRKTVVETVKEKRDYKKYKETLPYTLEKTDLECKICGEVFPVHKGLQVHMPIHFPNHICEQCGRWFATRTQLKTHVISHTTEREACPICPNRVFKATGGLKAHMRIHAGDKFHYKCLTCKLQFKSFNDRRLHFVAVHGEEERKYVCKQCPRRFCLPSQRASHVRRDHLQERSHVCPHCEAAFFDKYNLKKHMVKHTGERSYECSICKNRFGRKDTLKVHLKIHNTVKAR